MLVDDNEDLLFLLKKHLEVEGFSVSICPYGRNFAQAIRKKKPDVILMDIVMGAVSGSELCHYVRNNERTAGIKILIVSGNYDIDSVAESCGADGYIRKPFEMVDVTKKIRKALT